MPWCCNFVLFRDVRDSRDVSKVEQFEGESLMKRHSLTRKSGNAKSTRISYSLVNCTSFIGKLLSPYERLHLKEQHMLKVYSITQTSIEKIFAVWGNLLLEVQIE